MGKGRGPTHLISSWTKLTIAVLYCVGTTVEGCQASGLGHLLQYIREYNAESPKQDSERFISHGRWNTVLCPSRYIIYLWIKTVWAYCSRVKNYREEKSFLGFFHELWGITQNWMSCQAEHFLSPKLRSKVFFHVCNYSFQNDLFAILKLLSLYSFRIR